ncbi:MAG: tetratricopeptide repeat protein, partial [Bacteroidales bacterium]|nr:tetratricopeptide repeat protein [Bacteroidales bacterium]
QALELEKSILSIERLINGSDTFYASCCCDSIGKEYDLLGEYDKAIGYWCEALRIAENSENAKSMEMAAGLLNRIGQSYKRLGQFDKANDCFRRSSEKWKALGNDKQSEISLSDIDVE